MKIFISQPMKDMSEQEIMVVRDNIVGVMESVIEDLELIDSFLKDKSTPLEMLGESIKMLSKADLVVFAPGWDNARGCIVEHTCCEQYDIPMIEL